MIHELKTHSAPFIAILSGRKTYEIRRDDRSFAVGDVLRLREWNPLAKEYLGRTIEVMVTHKTQGGEWGLPIDVCVMAISREAYIRTTQ